MADVRYSLAVNAENLRKRIRTIPLSQIKWNKRATEPDMSKSVLHNAAMKAWLIAVDGFDDSIVVAETRSKATYRVLRDARDARFYSVTFASIKTSRCKRLDVWAAKQTKSRCVIMSYVELEDAP